MTGHLLSTISEGHYPACRHRVRTVAPRVSLVYTLRPARDVWLAWSVFPQHQHGTQHASPNRWRAGDVMDELEGSVSEPEGGCARASKSSAALVAEVVTQHQRWVALLMAMHARVGANALAACLPARVWEQLCVDAVGFSFDIDVQDAAGHSTHRLRAYSALKRVQLLRVLEPVFCTAGLRFGEFTLTVGGKRLDRLGLVGEACASKDGAAPVKVLAKACDPEDCIHLMVRSHFAEAVHFKLRRHTRLGGGRTAFCDRLQLSLAGIRFVFDGYTVLGHHTPESLDFDLEDGGVIDAILPLCGD